MEKKIMQNTSICHILLLCLVSCTNLNEYSYSYARNTAPYFDSINLNGTVFNQEEHGPFEIWECRKLIGGDEVLFEVGIFKNPKMTNVGFILYDRTSSGDLTSYQRKGINKRWNWETDSGSFSFIMKPDGIGHFFDFTGVSEDEKIESKEPFSCTLKTKNAQ